jgi:hypothetical protein
MAETSLNLGGWIFLAGAWSFIIAVTVLCFKRVLSTQNQTQE